MPFFRFQVNVQFCVDECNPVDCGEGVVSYGRRRRRDAVTSAPRATTLVPEPYASRLVFDQNLGQEVISVDTPLSKEIIVNQGTKVDSFRNPRSQDGFSSAGGGKWFNSKVIQLLCVNACFISRIILFMNVECLVFTN